MFIAKVKREGKGETNTRKLHYISEEDIGKKCTAQEFCQQTIQPVSNTKFSLNFNCSFATEVGRMYEKWTKPTLKSALTPR
jgi:hypothetical protein